MPIRDKLPARQTEPRKGEKVKEKRDEFVVESSNIEKMETVMRVIRNSESSNQSNPINRQSREVRGDEIVGGFWFIPALASFHEDQKLRRMCEFILFHFQHLTRRIGTKGKKE